MANQPVRNNWRVNKFLKESHIVACLAKERAAFFKY
jgi:hypothetical protein